MFPLKHRRTAATAASLRRILSLLRKHDRFLCTGHVRSDGDALGAQLALNFLLRRLGRKSHVVCDRGALPDYRFLPGADRVGSDPSDLRPPYDAVLTCDSGSWSRLERIGAALDRDRTTVINIDHHASNERFGDVNWIDPGYSSTGEMIWDLAKAAGVRPDAGIATCCYVAIVTDTGRFSFSNTTAETHLNACEMLACGVKPAVITKQLWRQKTPGQLRMAAEVLRSLKLSRDGRVAWIAITPAMISRTGHVPGDTQEYIDLLMSIRTVEAAVLFRESDGLVKVSWRTGPGIDGIRLARRWGGGGHPRASGASVAGSLAAVEREVIRGTIRFVGGVRRRVSR